MRAARPRAAVAALLLALHIWAYSATVADAYHGFALATSSVGDLRTTSGWQLACAKSDLLTSDFYSAPSKEVSIAFWFRTDAADDLTGFWGMSRAPNPNLFRFFQYPEQVKGEGNTVEMAHMDGGYISVSDKDGDFDFASWNFFTYVREAGAAGHGRMYVNGVEKANQTNTAILDIEMAADASEFANMCFGGYSQLDDAVTRERSSFAAMDDFYFITRALTPAEVLALYQDSRYAPASPLFNDPDVKLYYNFDEVVPYAPPAGGGPSSSSCGASGIAAGARVLEIVNLGSLGDRYNLLTGVLNGNSQVRGRHSLRPESAPSAALGARG